MGAYLTTEQHQTIQALTIAGKLNAALVELIQFGRTHEAYETACYIEAQQSYLMDVQAELIGMCRFMGVESHETQRLLLEMIGVVPMESGVSK